MMNLTYFDSIDFDSLLDDLANVDEDVTSCEDFVVSDDGNETNEYPIYEEFIQRCL